MATQREEFGADLGSVTTGRLLFTRGISELNLHATDSPEDLYRASFDGVIPEVRVEDGVITVEYPNILNPLKWGRISAEMGLNTGIPWEIEIRGGASGIAADLSRLEVKRFGVTGGMNDVRVELPIPASQIPFGIVGGVNDLTIHRPRDVAASLDITGGATNLTFDDQQFGAIGGKVSLKSTGYDDSTGRYQVSVTGGANNVSLMKS